MADFNGKFQYLNAGGGAVNEGACRVQFDAQTFTLTPDSGEPILCDLGDMDSVTAADYEIRLPVCTGSVLVLRQFGRSYETLAHDLLEAFRQRALECLLLEDLKETARFNGNFELTAEGAAPRAGTTEFRLFKSNLAVLPETSQGFQWRLADIDSVTFDPETYQVTLRSGQDALKAGKLAKRTEEFITTLKGSIGALATQSAHALHTAFPMLDPDQLQAAVAILKEGHSAPVSKLAAINPGFPAALTANAVDQDLKPYYDALLGHTAKDCLYAGFKMVRAEGAGNEDTKSENSGSPAGQQADAVTSMLKGALGNASAGMLAGPMGQALNARADALQPLYWFYFPIAGKQGPANLVAWEASSSGGRATYFFRLVDPARAAELADPARAAATIETALRRLDRVLGMLNFRRRPIYLSEDELQRDPKFHRYAIAARRIPEVREVRAAFAGRAIHASLEAWQAQVKSILEKEGMG